MASHWNLYRFEYHGGGLCAVTAQNIIFATYGTIVILELNINCALLSTVLLQDFKNYKTKKRLQWLLCKK